MAWVRVVVAISELEGLAWGLGWMKRGERGRAKIEQNILEIPALVQHLKFPLRNARIAVSGGALGREGGYTSDWAR